MTLNEYQDAARLTANYPNMGNNHVYPVLGLIDESGEVSGRVKRLMRDFGKSVPTDLSREEKDALALDIGDVLWYVAAIASEIQYDLATVAEMNVDKLKGRRGAPGASEESGIH